MRKIIAFSLWGDNPKYLVGAVKNAVLAQSIYPEWICQFHVGESVPVGILDTLHNFRNVEVIYHLRDQGNWNSMFWRFYPASSDETDIMISRDCDSRLNERERAAVLEWEKSDKAFHIMRDHPYHNTAILGGMWGSKKGAVPGLFEMLENRSKGDYWQVDQEFLRDVVYPIVKDKAMVHDEFFEKKPFPTPRPEDWSYVGEAYEHDDTRNSTHVAILMGNS